MKDNKLTPVQKRVLDFVIAQIEDNYATPSYREIAAALSFTHARAAQVVTALILKGYLTKGPDGKSRNIKLNPELYRAKVIDLTTETQRGNPMRKRGEKGIE